MQAESEYQATFTDFDFEKTIPHRPVIEGTSKNACEDLTDDATEDGFRWPNKGKKIEKCVKLFLPHNNAEYFVGRSNSPETTHISNHKAVSRKHLQIRWDYKLKRIYVTCLGRSGAKQHHGIVLAQGERTTNPLPSLYVIL